MRLISAVPAALFVLLIASAATAQPNSSTYPNRPIKVLVPFAAGGGGDIAARLISEEMSKTLKTPVVIENRPGGNGLVGAAQLAKAAPDGYTIGFSGSTVHAGGHAVFKTMPFHPINDFAPIALAFSSPQVLVVKSESSIKTEAELRSWIQANPKTASHSHHNGGSQIAAHLYLKRIQASALGVPYVSPVAALTDLVGGVTAFGFYEPVAAKPLIDSQRVRPLAVSSRARLPLLSGVPTLIESGLTDTELRTWLGFFAPAGTPQPIIRVLGEAVKSALEQASVKEKAHSLGMAEEYLPPDRFRDFLGTDTQFWKKRYEEAGIQPQ
ncbi:Bug family tripartite tricarboxylate transporter substrate binding protein [Ottowia thiooxydans]|uniref:Bug family tripartite tricarboxylate transporter substrate binding protein n=1 Tax=Ottowia thiooxydans TaxID=219182 RepID=UPI0003F86CD6|nr:tripartite tricarboxylate transporter substrate binding protein [Ottowia thiooxydans]